MGRTSDGLRLRDGVWYTDITFRGNRSTRSAFTADRKEAERIRDQRRGELWRIHIAGEAPRISFTQAAGLFLDNREGRVRDIETTRDRLRWLCAQSFGKLDINAIEGTNVRRVQEERRKHGVVRNIRLRNGDTKIVVVSKVVTDATLDRYAAAISAVLNYMHEIGNRRTAAPKVRKLSPRKRALSKFLTAEQVSTFIEHLADHHKPMVLFALSTGLRRSNVTGLTWDRVNLAMKKAWIPASEAKGGTDIAVPLSDDALAVLQGQQGKHAEWVFPYKGKPVHRVTGPAWREACEKAGIPRMTRFHDLRHTWASWHAMNGTPMKILQQLGGWATPSMVDVYATLAQEVVSGYANNAKPVSLTSTAQPASPGTKASVG